MINEKDLYKFILRRFLLTMVLVIAFQIFCDNLMHHGVEPLVKSAVGTDMFGNIGIDGGFVLLLGLFVGKVTSPVVGVNLVRLIDKILDLKLGKAMELTDFNNITGVINDNGPVYTFIMFICLIVMILLWVIPYVVGASVFATSVSKKVKLLEKQRLEEIAYSEKQKNLLLSDVAHDIKTPITTIAGFSQALLENRVDDDKKQEYLEAINTKSLQTVDMVSLLFEYVKLDSEGYLLKKTTEDVCEIFRNSVATYYTDFEDKQMEIDIDIPDDGIFLQVDRLQLERAFNNLLINAYKHNPEKTKMNISVSKLNSWVSFKISDNGTWIESETARQIFNPFVQADKSRTGKRGSGLGLSITRKIVEMHGGRIRLVQYKDRTPFTKTFEIQLKL